VEEEEEEVVVVVVEVEVVLVFRLLFITIINPIHLLLKIH
jgi:hypothetical protein